MYPSLRGNKKINRLLSKVGKLLQVNTKGQARNSIMGAYFETKISEAKRKIQVLLCVMRRPVNIIYGMMKNKTAYQLPEKSKVKGSNEKEQMISKEKLLRNRKCCDKI